MFDPRNIDHHPDPASYFADVEYRARNRRWEDARRQVKAMSKATPTAFEPLPVQPLHPVADIGPLYYQPRRHQHATSPTHSRNIDALLAKHGIYPRHRTRAASLRRKPLSQNQPSVFSWRAFALTASQAYPP